MSRLTREEHIPVIRPGLGAGPLDWLEEAGSMEDQLLQQARRTPSGEVIWLHPRSFREGASQPVRLGPSLYNGVLGVALFLAAMEHVEPREGRRDCILSALQSLRRQLAAMVAQPGDAHGEPHGLGGFAGLGGFIYGLVLIGRWLGEPDLIAEAAAAATLITPDRIAADETLDVMSGCAGAALALLVLDRVAPDPDHGRTPLERAVVCGEHLLDRRVTTDVGPRAWPAGAKPPRCGFAHGAAGIADCLTRLFERTGEARFREAAEEGVAFEHLHYDPEHGEWPLLGQSESFFVSSWCNGAPGVALGRLGMVALSGAEPVQKDLHAALRTTQGPASRMDDFLCCGYMGRAEILLHASEILGDGHLFQAAEEIASQVVSRSRNQDGLCPWLIPGSRFAPSLFRGAAGVAFTFLRLARPALLPCVLALRAEG